MNGNWTIAYNLESLSVSTDISLAGLVAAIPARSTRYIYTSSNQFPQLPPGSLNTADKQGILAIVKLADSRADLTYTVASTDTGTVRRFATAYNNGFTPALREWEQLATAEPPTVYALSTSTGITMGAGGYQKGQDGVVLICTNLSKSSSIVDGDALATLPVGFRPRQTMKYPANYAAPALGSTIAIDSVTGVITAGAGLTSQNGCYINISFPAAQ